MRDRDYEAWRDEWEIPLDDETPCDWCGECHPLRQACDRFSRDDDSLFDADELGLDPEDDRGESR